MTALTFDGFAAFVRRSATTVGETLAPDGDWEPTAFAVGHGNHMAVATLVGIEPKRYPRALLAFGLEVRPRLMGVVLSMWHARMSKEERDELGPGYRIEDDTERRGEMLMVGVGDVDHEEWWRAPIVRSRTMVRLGTWETTNVGGGRQIGSLRKACVR
jgi:hypothetical protein